MRSLQQRFGPPGEHRAEGSLEASFWLLDERILLLAAAGQASEESARWAATVQSEHLKQATEKHGRRMYVAWCFSGLRYTPKAGALFVGWLHENRHALLRTVCFTDNRLLRMTGMAANVSFNNTASFPATEAEFHATLEDWRARIQRPR